MVLNGSTTTRFVSSVTGLAKGLVCSTSFVSAWPSAGFSGVASRLLPPRKNIPTAITAKPNAPAAIFTQGAPLRLAKPGPP